MEINMEDLQAGAGSVRPESQAQAPPPHLPSQVPHQAGEERQGSHIPQGAASEFPFQWALVNLCLPVSLIAQLVKNLPAMRETWVRSPVGKIPWRWERLPTPVF